MGKDKVSFNLKVPKGTKDWAGSDVLLRDKIFNTISTVFKRHGGTTLDTPVFELKEILSGKYGEDSKLIYDLQDQGGELCSLRYDLTVPFARWLAMNPDTKSIKRYHIAKVYRRDQPAMTKGRMREFYQCDFDTAGANFDPMVPDAEILRIAVEVFEGLGWAGRYTIKVNHRKVLDGIFAVCGVPTDKIRTISSAVDKLDKLPWADVRKEMVDDKGLDPAVADKIETYVVRKGSRELLEDLLKDEVLSANESAKKGLEDMGLLMEYLEAFDCLDKISFDLSLARGLDYYTGVIYEVVTEGSAPATASGAPEAKTLQKKSKKEKKGGAPAADDDDRSNDPTIGVGSVAAGGRYDELVGMFSGKAQIPCVGISFGVDRIFSITKARMEAEKKTQGLRSNEVDVYVMAFGSKGFLKERMEVSRALWDAGVKVCFLFLYKSILHLLHILIPKLSIATRLKHPANQNSSSQAEFSYKLKPKLPAQFKAAETAGIPFAVIVAEDELAAGKVRIKELGLPDGHPEKDGVLVAREALGVEVKARLLKKLQGEELGIGGLVGGVEVLEVKDVKEGESAQTETESQTTGDAEAKP